MESNNSSAYNIELIVRTLIFFLSAFLILNNYELALAAAPNAATDPIGAQLCAIVLTLSGPTAKAISIVALIGVGVGLFMGKVNWGVALATAAGVIVIFSANTMISFLGGANASNAAGCS